MSCQPARTHFPQNRNTIAVLVRIFWKIAAQDNTSMELLVQLKVQIRLIVALGRVEVPTEHGVWSMGLGKQMKHTLNRA